MKSIRNPVLCGFNPDPSFIRVGDDFYLANSTFEWFPGVQIHHSKDLVHWRLIGHALTDKVRLDLVGIGDSCGVWAPSLSWCDGLFFLTYTNIRTSGLGRAFKDMPVYLITAENILGPWSEPIHLSSSGFDPSLFHDDDGRKWLVNMAWDYRKKGLGRFAGITVQEYDQKTRRMIGPVTKVLQKEALTEGPNIYKRNGTYYLMLAEGGTGWNHGISMARAKSIVGPYEVDPQGLVLTSRDDEKLELQKAGHGELVDTVAGEWYLAHLCSRPLGEGESRRCVLGRETAIQKVVWSDDGWLRLASGGVHPQVDVSAPSGLLETNWPDEPARDDFDDPKLNVHWSSLRTPGDESWLSVNERPGWLCLRGRDSLYSLFEQSMVARRLQAFHVVVETCLDFNPVTFNQSAGLICWYDTRTHYYLRVTHDEVKGKVLGIVLTDDSVYEELSESQVPIGDWKQCFLRAEIHHADLQFSVSPDGTKWLPIGPVLDASKLSDDYGKGVLHFTGAMIGLCAQDLDGTKAPAYFDYFEMTNL
jgi:xylan 1,4-beta-xylosidase